VSRAIFVVSVAGVFTLVGAAQPICPALSLAKAEMDTRLHCHLVARLKVIPFGPKLD